ncbi:MAG TPA: 2-phospho-L-lactate transferase CofD family protein, partial [Methylomirabilota bacterium]
EPPATIRPEVAEAIRGLDAVVIGPGSFYTSIMPPLLVGGVAEALAAVKGPILLIANLVTEGRGMTGFTAGEAVRRIGDTIGRAVDVVLVNDRVPPAAVLARYEVEHKLPLPLGEVPAGCEIIEGDFWRPEIARHDRWRLAYAVWSVLSRRLL